MERYENRLITKELDRLNINVSCMFRAVLEPGRHFKAQNPGFNRVYYVRSGKGTIFCGGEEIPMVPGGIYLLPAHADFSYTIEKEMEKIYFHLNVLRFDYSDLMQCVPGCVWFEGRESAVEEMYALALQKEDIMSVLQIKTRLYQLLAEVLEQNGGVPGDIEQYSPLVKKAIRYVERQKHFGMNSKEIAAALLVSESTLRQTFQKEVGISVGRYINERLLFTAEQQLRLTNRPVKEISSALGFADPFYFSRVFSARYGLSPLAYRKVGGE